MVYLLFVQNADPTLANLLHFRLIFIVANGQILNNNLVTLPRVQLGVYAKLKGSFKLLQNFDFVVSLRWKTFYIKVLQMQQ